MTDVKYTAYLYGSRWVSEYTIRSRSLIFKFPGQWKNSMYWTISVYWYFISGYTVVQLNLAGYVDVSPQMFCDAVLFLCLHGPSCVMSDVESTSCSCFSCLRSLRVHSVEGVSKRLRLLYVVFSVSVNGSDKTVHDGESFRFLGMGHTWSSASVALPPPFSFLLVGKCLWPGFLFVFLSVCLMMV